MLDAQHLPLLAGGAAHLVKLLRHRLGNKECAVELVAQPYLAVHARSTASSPRYRVVMPTALKLMIAQLVGRHNLPDSHRVYFKRRGVITLPASIIFIIVCFHDVLFFLQSNNNTHTISNIKKSCRASKSRKKSFFSKKFCRYKKKH